jgi:hypothetical protein
MVGAFCGKKITIFLFKKSQGKWYFGKLPKKRSDLKD